MNKVVYNIALTFFVATTSLNAEYITYNNQYLSINNNTVILNAHPVNWTFVTQPNDVTLIKSPNGKYLSYDQNKLSLKNKETPSAAEQWRLLKRDPEYVIDSWSGNGTLSVNAKNEVTFSTDGQNTRWKILTTLPTAATPHTSLPQSPDLVTKKPAQPHKSAQKPPAVNKPAQAQSTAANQ